MSGFCERCRDMVEVSVKSGQKEHTIKGRAISYVGKTAYCCNCGEEVFVPEIRDYNLNELDEEYRKAEGLITVEEMEQILLKYDIGKRPLSLLLGWGEGTLTRYIDGDIPTKPYSDTLRRILEDKEYFREELERNKGNITDYAYRKSLVTLDAECYLDGNKLESATKYLLLQTSEITPLALQKLLYYAQGFYFSFTNEYMFEENCEAWVHGPVYRNIYDKYRDYGYHPIGEKDLRYEDANLPKEERELLDHIVLYFGCYSGKVLEIMTHAEEPWRVTRRGLDDQANCNRIIKKEVIAAYFKSVKEKFKMLNFTDIKDYSTNLFDKLCVAS